ncbi:MAG: GIY-YIG nuclease family protein [Eubacterium sp.]|nr:GIY-YIG nuclease family protein [Eubacterium sp.]
MINFDKIDFSYLTSLSGPRLIIAVVLPVLIIAALLITLYSINNRSLKGIIYNSKEISVKRFLRLRNIKGKGQKLASNKIDVPGVYIIHNHSERKYYVGQAQHIVSRANSHFTAKGNGRVYADYARGDRFTIRFVALKKSRAKNLNDLERYYIKKYNASEIGYNRTKGNSPK